MGTSRLFKCDRAAEHQVAVVCAIALLILSLAGCGSAPGSPRVRTSSVDGEGPLVPGCQYVSSSDTSLEFSSHSYLTTLASAWREGAAAGLYEGTQQGSRDIGLIILDEYLRAFAYDLLPDSEVFCRVYNAEPQKIDKIVGNLISSFGYRWKYENQKQRLLSTDYVYRTQEPMEMPTWFKCKKCEKPKPQARWKDRFFVDIKPFSAGKTIVRVRRDVYIARWTKEGWSDYIKGTSVGYNEAVILNLIQRNL